MTDPNNDVVSIPSFTADAARASVSPHTVHLELAMSRPDGALHPILHLAISAAVAAELGELLLRSVARCSEIRSAIASADLESPTPSDIS